MGIVVSLSQFATKLDPLDARTLEQFQVLTERLIEKLNHQEQGAHKERMSSAIQSLVLSSVTEDAPFAYRLELIEASRELDRATNRKLLRGNA